MSVCAVVGGQFGSEGKGLIVGHIAREYDYHVRVGAANAGHTVYTCDPNHTPGTEVYEKHVMQQVPCAAYANPDAELIVGPGATISMDILLQEVKKFGMWRAVRGLPPKKVIVDPRAHIVLPEHVDAEGKTNLAERIGSTSTIAREGIGSAQAARVMREEGCFTFEEHVDLFGLNQFELRDVPACLAKRDRILLEGTQGTGLSLTTGRFPYVTSRNTTVAGLCADAGVAPTRLDRITLVCRTFPIRVAGNSGPFWSDGPEISWEDIGIDPESERTTVTKKVRRVAHFSPSQLEESITLNRPTEIALTFCDYLDPEIKGREGIEFHLEEWPRTQELVGLIESNFGVPVTMLGTGPHSVIDYHPITRIT